MISYNNLEELTKKELSILFSLADLIEKNKGEIYKNNDGCLKRLKKFNLIESARAKDPSKIEKGNSLYVITTKGKGLVDAGLDYMSQTLNSMDGKDIHPDVLTREISLK